MPTLINTNLKHIKKNSNYIILSLSITVYMALIIIYPQTISSGIKNGINCCLDVLIPSMFPFMVAASIVSLSGMEKKTKSIFGAASKFLFYLPPHAVPAIIMSLFGGYPVGAYCVKSLYKSREINKEQMNRMMCFCVNFGPAFIISALGQTLLNNLKAGFILFFIQVIASILIGVITGIIARIKKHDFYLIKNHSRQKNSLSFSRTLIEACNDASKSLFGMCTIITLFFGIVSLVNKLELISYISRLLLKINVPLHTSSTILLSLIEMTQSCIISAKNTSTPYYIYSWIIGFGGICAHTQIIAQLSDCPFKYTKFLIMRIINGLFTSVVTALIIKNPEKTLQTFAPSSVINQSTEISKASPTHLGSIVLLIFCVIFTVSVHPHTNLYFGRRHIKKVSAEK
ncbi:MAG: hypothetical protein IKE05_01695 [Clostridia bacterium]|nr:hypothetical protein [Clostridia bacterium]